MKECQWAYLEQTMTKIKVTKILSSKIETGTDLTSDLTMTVVEPNKGYSILLQHALFPNDIDIPL